MSKIEREYIKKQHISPPPSFVRSGLSTPATSEHKNSSHSHILAAGGAVSSELHSSSGRVWPTGQMRDAARGAGCPCLPRPFWQNTEGRNLPFSNLTV